MIKIGTIICFLFLLLLPSVGLAHSGNTDSYGGHNKTANGTYHCHSGECLEDAKEDAYNYYYPLGQEDGKEGNDFSKDISQYLFENNDIDVFEYKSRFALEAYKMGYEETYVPTFWEKYKLIILILSGVAILCVINYLVQKR